MPQPLQKLREYAPTLGVLAVLFLVIIGIWAVWRVPQWQVQHALDAARNDPELKNTPLLADSAKQLELEDNFRKTIVQGLGGAIVLLGLYYSARTFGLSRQGHITDRFTKAIEQLGKLNGDHPAIEVRLGGIYALERIAIDSPRDHWTIMEVLTAYVRQNAPLEPERAYSKGETPRTDIQAILTVLGRRRTGPTRQRPEQRLDLTSSRLCGTNLEGANLQDTSLTNANLQDTSLTNANLQGANFEDANLEGADLSSANLTSVALICANLQGADLRTANLQGANLFYANLQGAELICTNLQYAKLQGADLFGASLLLITGWTLEGIKSATRWETAHYDPDLRKALGLPPEETIEPDALSHPDPDKPTEDA
jgi:Pentapeptide repeats (8 copies)